jgi:hypothetical protein
MSIWMMNLTIAIIYLVLTSQGYLFIEDQDILCYEIFTVFGLCSAVSGHTRSRMLNNSGTSTDTSDYRSYPSTYNGSNRCNHGSTDGSSTDRELEF